MNKIPFALALALVPLSCSKSAPEAASMEAAPAQRQLASSRGGGPRDDMAEMAAAPAAPPPGAGAVAKSGMAERRAKMGKKDAAKPMEDALGGEGGGAAFGAAGLMAKEADSSVEAEEAAPATRAWFPESFLFEPRLVTDAGGRASLNVKIPDRLTTWRVLALAHTRAGEQAGAVTQLLGTLPVYVEPVVPRQLIAGDVVRVPVQLVNTTDAPLTRRLDVAVEGGGLDARPRDITVPAGGSTVETVVVSARQPGELALTATLKGADAIRRTVTVVPRGQRVVVERAGTLAAPRERAIAAPEGEFSSVSLEVFPGALAVVRSELASAGQRGGVADVAYALLLAGEAPALLTKLGGDVDAEALRTLRIIATQRALRHARAPSLETATLLAEGAFAHPDQPVLARLGERLSAQLAGGQRPDGTYGGANGWTLQRLLAGTAESVHAAAAEARAADARVATAAAGSAGPSPEDTAAASKARARAEATRIRASAAVERNLGRVEDPYTAALLVASGAAQGTVADKLRTIIKAAVKTGEDGARTVELGPGVVRIDGTRPGPVELAAIATLALAGDAEAAPWLADLAGTVLAGYQPGQGFGDGRTSVWALRAVLATFSQPLPTAVKITLGLDGQTLSEGTFDARQLRDVLHLDARVPEAGGERKWSIRAEPAVAGLGYRLALTTWVPLVPPPEDGVALRVQPAAPPQVGRPVSVSLIVAAPAGYPVEIVHRLPAGVVPDRPSLDALVSAGTLSSYDTEDGAVRLSLPALEASTPWQASYRVVPTLAGTLQSGASTLTVAGETRTLPTPAWTIAP